MPHDKDGNVVLFRRKIDKKMLEEVKKFKNERIRKVALIGTPGIGKSTFLFFLLRDLLKSNKTVIFDSRKQHVVWKFVPKAGDECEVRKLNPERSLWDPKVDPEATNEDCWWLIDPSSEGCATDKWTTNTRACTVIAASPDRRHIGDFEKDGVLEKIYVPVWELDELQVASKMNNGEEGASKEFSDDSASVGRNFESLAHYWLAKGGEFTLDGKKHVIDKRDIRDVADADLSKFIEQATKITVPCYLQPTAPTLPLIDSAEAGAEKVYQITINKSHTFDLEKLKAVVDLLKDKKKKGFKPLEFIWVVPECLKVFTHKSLEDTKKKIDLTADVEQKVLVLRNLTPPQLPK
eukprot:TRINITY_DN20678_c1_g2_i2.p2 TRINITY_DN20678_c1_g2~~TRINITY_DN20678_c1_g2_i2.p2  ORF type:complete len:349 (+),score=128.89 TRINITY_DN20678_c1_g2_i2:117-1163(+)